MPRSGGRSSYNPKPGRKLQHVITVLRVEFLNRRGSLAVSLDRDDFRQLRIQEHIGTAEEGLFPKGIKLVLSERCDEDFRRCKPVHMPLFDFCPMRLSNVPQHDIHGRMVVPNQNVSVIHRGGFMSGW